MTEKRYLLTDPEEFVSVIAFIMQHFYIIIILESQ
jgi:hypothetical protein